MTTLLMILNGLIGIGTLICFILVVVKMFQTGNTGLGIACIILFLCFYIGGLIAFIWGWVKSTDYNLKNIMLIWTLLIVLSFAIGGVLAALGVDMVADFRKSLGV